MAPGTLMSPASTQSEDSKKINESPLLAAVDAYCNETSDSDVQQPNATGHINISLYTCTFFIISRIGKFALCKMRNSFL